MQRSSSGAAIGLSSPMSSSLMDAGRNIGLEATSTSFGGGVGNTSGLPMDGRAANFVPKLLAKLTALEDKVNRMMESKLDVVRYDRDEDRRMATEDGILDEIRNIKDGADEMSQLMTEVQASLRNKADLSSHERALRQLQELQATCANKTDMEMFKMLQDSVLIAESNIESLQNAMNYKAGTATTDQHTRQLEQIAEAITQKTDVDQTLQLQSELCAVESSVEMLSNKMHDKADLQDHEKHGRILADLTNALHGKTDLVSFATMEKSFQKVQEIAMQADYYMKAGVQVTEFQQVKEDLRELCNLVEQKAEQTQLNSVENDLQLESQRIDSCLADLEVRRQEEAELKGSVRMLSTKSASLEQLSHLLVATKADATNVPHLHERVLDDIHFS
eukprot:TRINITY_DN9871_c0_g1_i1.p1 TRINITY_DN9871_c0_g1~~TRINITY_DN9871_c0_g1_i1.p1  ORF type:complete len:390 (+),score=130.94 TRINITY_DN9871_c0_g1_i1:60-1229(+)